MHTSNNIERTDRRSNRRLTDRSLHDRFLNGYNEMMKAFNEQLSVPFNNFIEKELNYRDIFNRSPSTDCIMKEDCYVYSVQLPGIPKEDIKLTIDNGFLNISAERKEVHNDEGSNYRFRECTYGLFNRSYKLPNDTMEKDILAEHTNGVLHVTIPRVNDNTDTSKVIKIN
jgi:HSP20 family protein